jgi:transcriptional regulator with XRE-family HTH domain
VRINEVGTFLKNHRWDNRMRQKQMAHKLGIDNSVLSAIERGSRQPNTHTLLLLARGLDCELDIQFKPKMESSSIGSTMDGKPRHF